VPHIDFHHHAKAAAIRAVIDGMMFINREIAQIMRSDFQKLLFNRLLEQRLLKIRLNDIGKNCNKIKSNHKI